MTQKRKRPVEPSAQPGQDQVELQANVSAPGGPRSFEAEDIPGAQPETNFNEPSGMGLGQEGGPGTPGEHPQMAVASPEQKPEARAGDEFRKNVEEYQKARREEEEAA